MIFRASLIAISVLIASMGNSFAFEINGTAGTTLKATEISTFNEPWAMTFLPDGSFIVNEKSGFMVYVDRNRKGAFVDGVPNVAYAGQGGLGDVITHPEFAQNGMIYFSYAEDGPQGRGAVVKSAILSTEKSPALSNIQTIWEQDKTSGNGHYSHKLAIDGDKLFITSGDRQKLDPAQDMSSNLGKLIRLNLDGSVPADNPFQNEGEKAKTFWSVGHRNLLGIDFAADGTLWTHEMGPRHGDELNLIEAGSNYGWPFVSNGDHYSGVPIPDHISRPEFNAPEAYWVPSIAPSGLVIYDGDMFEKWNGDALIGGLVSQAFIHVNIDGTSASEAERFEWGERIREVEQGPDGAIYVLEDGPGARLLKLEPA